MNRDMVLAQKQLFAVLEESYKRTGTPMPEAGRNRFVTASSPLARERLQKLECLCWERFTPTSALLQIHSDDCGSFLVAVGLHPQATDDLEGYASVEIDSGLFQVSILESKVIPTASPQEIREAVAWGSIGDPDYSGHPYLQLTSLFPQVAAVEMPRRLSKEEMHTLFWKVVLAHCNYGPSWIEERLVVDMRSLGEVAVPGLPYTELAWAALSHDPRTVFLALYRCLEAAYAYGVASKINEELGLECGWEETARALGAHAGWRPQEEVSLVRLLQNADPDDVRQIGQLLGSGKSDPHEAAGSSIYRLRNGIVHFRPEMELVEVYDHDWVGVCAAMSRIVVTVLSAVHKIE